MQQIGQSGPASLPNAIQQMRTKFAFEALVAACHSLVARHNAGSGSLMQIEHRRDRFEVFQRGLIFPSLTLYLNPGSCDIWYHRPSRTPNRPPEEGAITAGFDGKLQLRDVDGISHPIAADALALALLGPALMGGRLT